MRMNCHGTYGPIPVRLNTFVTALFDERVLEELDIIPVPREEEAGKVDLSTRLMKRDGRET